MYKVSGLLNRRGFNIDSITVGDCEVEGLSRMVITVNGDSSTLEQVTKQLNKLVEVIKINDISNNSVKRELCLIKVKTPNEAARDEIMQFVDIYRAKIIDASESNLLIEITGKPSKSNAFILLMEQYGIITITRTGLTAMSRGNLNDWNYFLLSLGSYINSISTEFFTAYRFFHHCFFFLW